MISRTATGLIVGTPARVGTSALATVSGLEVAGFAVELVVTPEGALVAEAVAGLAVFIVPAGFDLDATADVGFAGAAPVGLAVVLDVAGFAVEVVPEFTFELDGAADAGLATEVRGGAGFGVCAGFAPEVALAP